ncbi:MAG: L,D-transpeptidase [Desulfarculales bacterium]|jgi:murein L,D-transpeptidase YafK|nr:L,D-transpeptidase [Desulfarculales bacterium]
MKRRLFAPRKKRGQKIILWLSSVLIVIVAFIAGAMLWQWWHDDKSEAAALPSPDTLNSRSVSVPIVLAKQENQEADNNRDANDSGMQAAPAPNSRDADDSKITAEQPLAPVDLPEQQFSATDPSSQSPLNQPLASRDDGTPTFVFCFEGKLPETRLLVVDKSRQRLMVLRYMGEMVLEYEYPCATGANAGSKQTEGDSRTPVGIYFTTHRYIDRQMSVFGYQAIHLDYPNAFDMDQSRNGNGIYIHGTNQDLQPRSSNGCIAMRNEDIAHLGELIKEQVTPVIVVESLSLPELNQRIKACDWLQTISSLYLSAQVPRVGYGLGLLNPPGDFHYSKQPTLDLLGEKIWRWAQMKGQVKTTTGMSVFGLGNQWVLVANQIISINRQDYNITRRFYLEGDDPRQAGLIRSSLILDNQNQARDLAKAAPEVPPLAVANNAAISSNSAPNPATGKDSGTAGTIAASPPEQSQRDDEVRLMLKNWLAAWGSKNLNNYMSYYANDFKSDRGQNYSAWKNHKTELFRVYKTIRIRTDNLVIKFKNDNNAEITFKQYYRSDWTRDVGIKTLEIVKRNRRWLITRESWVASD